MIRLTFVYEITITSNVGHNPYARQAIIVRENENIWCFALRLVAATDKTNLFS